MATRVTIDDIDYTLRMDESGNILVQHPNGQYNAMHGRETGGLHEFEVHPCQRHQYAFWLNHLPPEDRKRTGSGKDGPQPPWSLRKARTDTSIESTVKMLKKQRGSRDSNR